MLNLKKQNRCILAVVETQLVAEWSLPTPEDRGLSLVSVNFIDLPQIKA